MAAASTKTHLTYFLDKHLLLVKGKQRIQPLAKKFVQILGYLRFEPCVGKKLYEKEFMLLRAKE